MYFVICYLSYYLFMVRELLCYLSLKRRLYNLTREFRSGMLAVLIEGFSGRPEIKLYTHPFVRRSGGLKPRPENPCTKVGKKIIL